MDVVQLSRVCVSPSEVKDKVESWLLKHFGDGNPFKEEPQDECPITKSNIEYHRRHHLNKQLYSILHGMKNMKVSIRLKQLKKVRIYTRENLDIFLDFVLNAVSTDTSCAVGYARLCREIVIDQGSQFKQALCKKCQQVFEKKSVAYIERRLKVVEIKTGDSTKVEGLKSELELYDCHLRSQYIAFIQFIGELFLHQILSNNVIVNYIHGLLSRRDDEGLECACVLLKMVGKVLETCSGGLHQIFYILHSFVNSNQGNISYKVWDMAHEVFALRSSSWSGVNQA